jgi:hypothetical protein
MPILFIWVKVVLTRRHFACFRMCRVTGAGSRFLPCCYAGGGGDFLPDEVMPAGTGVAFAAAGIAGRDCDYDCRRQCGNGYASHSNDKFYCGFHVQLSLYFRFL